MSVPEGSATGGCLPLGVSAPGGYAIPACTEADPPVNRITDRHVLKLFTYPSQTSFAGGKEITKTVYSILIVEIRHYLCPIPWDVLVKEERDL